MQSEGTRAPPASMVPLSSKIEEVRKTVLERHQLDESGEELRLMLIEYPPAAAAPVHVHPAQGLCYVLEGTAVSKYEEEGELTLHAGDTYQDAASKRHLVWRNQSETLPLRFLCYAKIGVDQAFAMPVE